MQTQVDEMALYVPPEKPWLLKLRSNESFKAELEDVVRCWRIHATARGDDPNQIDVSYVVRRILEKGVADVFAEYGGRPTQESDWARLEKAITQAVKASAKR